MPDLERFMIQTNMMETRHEMHTRLLVGQTAIHFVKTASTMFKSFLDWCANLNGQVYVEHLLTAQQLQFEGKHDSPQLTTTTTTTGTSINKKICFLRI